MRFAALTFAFGCAVTVSALPVDSGNGEGGDLQAATGFPTGDILSNSGINSGDTSLDAIGPTPSVPCEGSAPTDAASLTDNDGASALDDPVFPTSSVPPAFPTFRVVNDRKFIASPGSISPNNASNSTGASVNPTNSGLKGPRVSLDPDPAAVAQSDETGFNNSDFNFFARDNGTLLDNITSGDLNLTVHEFGSETGFRRAMAWVLARSSSSPSEDSHRSRNARNVDLDLDLLK